MHSIEDAFLSYATHCRPLATESVPLPAALGRVLAAPAQARTDLPAFTQSALDGYALAHASLAQADQGLQLDAAVAAAGVGPGTQVAPGHAVRIFTGGMLPPGTDTIARQEIVRNEAGRIHLDAPLRLGEGVRRQADEVKAGQTLAQAGQVLDAGLLAALAMAGVTSLEVHRRPRIALLVSGDEVVPFGQALRPGQVHDANGALLQAWFAERGYHEVSLEYLPDDPEATRQRIAAGLASADLVITTGGVSVGDKDYIPAAAEALGLQPHFWKLAQKPGKPLWFGSGDAGMLLGIPGNPGAVWTCLAIHVVHVLDRMEGRSRPRPCWLHGTLAQAIRADAQRTQWLRVHQHVSSSGQVLLGPLPAQESHMLSNLASTNAIVRLPPRDIIYAQGEVVDWIPVD